jgi:DNA-binding CsgD family transcriptional regulator
MGMTSQINGNLVQGVAHYQRAVALFRDLGDRHGLVSSLATLALCGPSYLHDSSFSPFNLAEAVENGNAALTLARAIGWRSGEIYALHCLSICLGPQGAIQPALESIQLSLEISEEIGHDQWLIGAHSDLGLLYLEVFALLQARQHLELAFKLAQEIGSAVWIGSVTGYLASVCILQGELSHAQELLDAQLTADTPAQTQMQRICWCTYAELALARQEPDMALALIDRLIASDPNMAPGVSAPRLSILRSGALSALQRLEEAESDLQIGLAAALLQGGRTWEWRIHFALGRLYQAQDRRSKARAEFEVAHTILQALASSILDPTLRAIFAAHILTLFPVPSRNPSRRVDKLKFAGLTAREREVAALIAQGQSNHAIAELLVVSERTVESHVTNILAKLDFTSRARIAVWAVDKGLVDPTR